METKASWELISKGTPREFATALCREAMEHPAVHHPYLQRLSRGEFPDMMGAVRDYAYQYSFYGSDFVNYLSGVIGSLPTQRQREIIYENLDEERGDPKATELEKMPHVKMFQHFRRAAGVDENYEKNAKACTTVLVWRDLFFQKCQSRQLGVALGGMGMGTEYVVPTIYRYILKGLKEHTKLTERDYYFFELHAHCDDGHAADLIDIAVELAEDSNVREGLRFGVFSALNLRRAVWDVMLARATDMPAR